MTGTCWGCYYKNSEINSGLEPYVYLIKLRSERFYQPFSKNKKVFMCVFIQMYKQTNVMCVALSFVIVKFLYEREHDDDFSFSVFDLLLWLEATSQISFRKTSLNIVIAKQPKIVNLLKHCLLQAENNSKTRLMML